MVTLREHPNRTAFQRDVGALLRLTLGEARTMWADRGHAPFTVNPPDALDTWYVHSAGWSGWGDKCADAPSSALAVWVGVSDFEPLSSDGHGPTPGRSDVYEACSWTGMLHWTWDDGAAEPVPALADGQPASATWEPVQEGAEWFIDDLPGGTKRPLPSDSAHAACLVSAGTTYRLTAKMREDLVGNPTLDVAWLSDPYDGAARDILSTDVFTIAAGVNVWATDSIDLVAPAGAVAVQFGQGGNTQVSEVKFEQVG